MEFTYITAIISVLVAMATRAIATPLPGGNGDCSNPSHEYLRLRLSELGTHEDDIISSSSLAIGDDDSTSSVGSEMRGVLGGMTSDFVCPWEWDLSSDSTRFPEHLATVTRCSCSRCQGAPLIPGRRIRRGRCEIIERSVTVLRRAGCENGVYTYIPDRVTVGVGCGCKLQRHNRAIVSTA